MLKSFIVSMSVIFLLLAFSSQLQAQKSTGFFAYEENATMLGGDIIAAFPTGDFGEALSTSWGFQGSFQFPLFNNFFLLASIAYINWVYKQTFPNDYGWTSYSLPVLLGIYYMFAIQQMYFYAGLGVGLHTIFDTYKSPAGSRTENVSKFQANPGVGLFYPLAAGIMLNFAINYAIVFGEHSNLTYLAIMAGARLRL